MSFDIQTENLIFKINRLIEAEKDQDKDDQYRKVMTAFDQGTLQMKGGKKVTDRKQAQAIAASERNIAQTPPKGVEGRGRSERNYKGVTRTRPSLKKKKEE